MPENFDIPKIESIQRIELNEKEKNILEVGCGIAPFFIVPTKEEVINLGEAHYVGLDIRKGRSSYVADYLKNKKLHTKFEFITGEGEKLPFKDNVFDEVIFNNIFGDATLLSHKYGNESVLFPKETELKKESFINEAFRILKKDGKMIVFETYTPEEARDFFEKIDFNNDGRFSLSSDAKFQKSMEILLKKKKVRENSFFLVYEKIYE